MISWHHYIVRVSTIKTRTKTYRVPQIVESYRDPVKGPRTKILDHLGQIEGREDQFEKIIAGLQRALGKMEPGELVFDDSKDFGHIRSAICLIKPGTR